MYSRDKLVDEIDDRSLKYVRMRLVTMTEFIGSDKSSFTIVDRLRLMPGEKVHRYHLDELIAAIMIDQDMKFHGIETLSKLIETIILRREDVYRMRSLSTDPTKAIEAVRESHHQQIEMWIEVKRARLKGEDATIHLPSHFRSVSDPNSIYYKLWRELVDFVKSCFLSLPRK
jgi:hypothetical protein